MRDIIWLDGRPTTMGTIALAVADEWDLPVELLLSRRRTTRVAWPRQVAMYLCTLDGKRSLPQVGRFFHRDHTTVLHAESRVLMMLARDKREAQRVDKLIGNLGIVAGERFHSGGTTRRSASVVPGHSFDGAQPTEHF